MHQPLATGTNSWPKWLSLAIAVIFIVLNVIRMTNIAITFDEAWTYIYYVSSGWKNILACIPPTANNHILNSLLAKGVIQLVGSDDLFLLRLPNLLAQIVYLYFGYMLLRKILVNQWWVLAGFILLNCNPFFFEFWGLCRGYGISISLMMAAIYYLLKYTDADNLSFLFLSLVLMALSTFSTFSVLNVYMGLVAVVFIRTLFFRTGSKKKYLLKESVVVVLCSILLYIMIAQPVIELHSEGEFYYGLKNGFVADTIGTLIKESLFYQADSYFITTISYLVVAITIFAGMHWLMQLRRTEQNNTFQNTLLWLLLIIPAFSTIVQHWVFGTLFLIERTALFFYPLFILQLVVFLKSIKYESVKRAAVIICSLLVLVNFGCNINTTNTHTWYQHQYDELVINRITTGKHKPAKIKLNWVFMPTFAYYKMRSYPLSINAGDVGPSQQKKFALSTYADTAYDYYYIHADDIASIPKGYVEDTSFFDGKYVLLKKD